LEEVFVVEDIARRDDDGCRGEMAARVDALYAWSFNQKCK
jgi:hypothetical protein